MLLFIGFLSVIFYYNALLEKDWIFGWDFLLGYNYIFKGKENKLFIIFIYFRILLNSNYNYNYKKS